DTETIDGNICEKYLVKTVYKGTEYQSLEWRAKELDGFVVKRQGIAGDWTSEYKNIQFGPPPTNLFEIPASYTKVSYSRDWAPVVSALWTNSMSIEEARKAGLRVEVRKESNGDEFIDYIDAITGTPVLNVHKMFD